MKNKYSNFKLGIFVTVSLVLLIVSLYYIGNKKHLFSKTTTIYAVFHSIDGLRAGNNVRFAGIDIGNVSEVKIINDSTVIVSIQIEEDASRFINKNAVANVGSDGLMGNKLVNIIASSVASTPIANNDTLLSETPIASDQMMRTLNNTNNNVLDITNDLKNITKRINSSNALWSLLSDTGAANQLLATIDKLESTANNANRLSSDASQIVKDIRAGKGSAGKLLVEDSIANEMEGLLIKLNDASDTAKLALHHMHEFMKDLNMTPGSLGVLARDTVMANDMKSMMFNLKESTYNLNENMKALQGNVFFKSYFKNQEKKEEKKEKKGK
jgi:phospholipid/cholesterol/gamma-HCH transport system substrate-binding protein